MMMINEFDSQASSSYVKNVENWKFVAKNENFNIGSFIKYYCKDTINWVRIFASQLHYTQKVYNKKLHSIYYFFANCYIYVVYYVNT